MGAGMSAPKLTAAEIDALNAERLAAVEARIRECNERTFDIERRHPWLVVLYILAIFAAVMVSALYPWGTAHAQTTMGLHLATQHLEHTEQRLNTATPGLYVRTEAGATFGVFRNSYSRTSAYAAWTFQTPGRRFALTAGAITGYSAQKVMPLLTPSVRFGVADGYAVRLAYIPKPLKRGHSSGLHLTLETEF